MVNGSVTGDTYVYGAIDEVGITPDADMALDQRDAGARFDVELDPGVRRPGLGVRRGDEHQLDTGLAIRPGGYANGCAICRKGVIQQSEAKVAWQGCRCRNTVRTRGRDHRCQRLDTYTDMLQRSRKGRCQYSVDK